MWHSPGQTTVSSPLGIITNTPIRWPLHLIITVQPVDLLDATYSRNHRRGPTEASHTHASRAASTTYRNHPQPPLHRPTNPARWELPPRLHRQGLSLLRFSLHPLESLHVRAPTLHAPRLSIFNAPGLELPPIACTIDTQLRAAQNRSPRWCSPVVALEPRQLSASCTVTRLCLQLQLQLQLPNDSNGRQSILEKDCPTPYFWAESEHRSDNQSSSIHRSRTSTNDSQPSRRIPQLFSTRKPSFRPVAPNTQASRTATCDDFTDQTVGQPCRMHEHNTAD
ncbi:hypothetical protein B7494_g8281 [Chlorociboria aeruginascens]|nr:hypothetical protein B7494_g8281 [Chlorociboria aeruginascens]